MDGLLGQAAVFLLAAVVAVPLSKRLGLGAVLGYLAAGLIIGPSVLGLVTDVDGILHFAELGVVMLLFVIGLELHPSRLWVMRRSVFGLGIAQFGLSAVAIAAAIYYFPGEIPGIEGNRLAVSIAIGVALANSSTAFALQILAERKQLATRQGRSAFSVLLFQDLAVIPTLALIPLLGTPPARPTEPVEQHIEPLSWVAKRLALEFPEVEGWGVWLDIAIEVLAIVLIVVTGRYFLRLLFVMVAASAVREIFTASALLVVLGMALLMEHIGLSMAMGAFVAGVLLANSEYKHSLEADIDPFKGLLLGLFFIAVGMSLKLDLVISNPVEIIALVIVLVAGKWLILFCLGLISGLGRGRAASFANSISQCGEFAFVILGVAVASNIMTGDLKDSLIVIVTLSMVATPILFIIEGFFQRASKAKQAEAEPKYDKMPEEEHPVIIAGFGRFGQIIGRILRAKQIGFIALEIDQKQVEVVRKIGNKIYYGDASRLDLLRAAKAAEARIFVLAIDDVEASLRTAATVIEHFPNLRIFARARDRQHAYKLQELGVQVMRRETFLASTDLAREVLMGVGLTATESTRVVERFKAHDRQRLYHDRENITDEERMIVQARQAAEELEEMIAQDDLDAAADAIKDAAD